MHVNNVYSVLLKNDQHLKREREKILILLPLFCITALNRFKNIRSVTNTLCNWPPRSPLQILRPASIPHLSRKNRITSQRLYNDLHAIAYKRFAIAVESIEIERHRLGTFIVVRRNEREKRNLRLCSPPACSTKKLNQRGLGYIRG